MTTDIEIFDNSYVSETDTKADIEKKSSTKEFIQEPLSTESMTEYGTSKPTRIIIKAKITNG